jgi:hypothetical protein
MIDKGAEITELNEPLHEAFLLEKQGVPVGRPEHSNKPKQ